MIVRVGKIAVFSLASLLLFCGLLMFVSIADNAIAEELETVVSSWTVLASNSTAADNDLTAAGNERTHDQVESMISTAAGNDAEMTIYNISRSALSRANVLRLRCIGTTDADDVDYNIYTGTLRSASDCDLTLLCTIEYVIDTQTSYRTNSGSNLLYADVAVVTQGDVTKTIESAGTLTRIVEVTVDLQGADLLVIVPTVVDGYAELLGKFY